MLRGHCCTLTAPEPASFLSGASSWLGGGLTNRVRSLPAPCVLRRRVASCGYEIRERAGVTAWQAPFSMKALFAWEKIRGFTFCANVSTLPRMPPGTQSHVRAGPLRYTPCLTGWTDFSGLEKSGFWVDPGYQRQGHLVYAWGSICSSLPPSAVDSSTSVV